MIKFISFSTIDERGDFHAEKTSRLIKTLNNNANCTGGFIDYASLYPLVFVFVTIDGSARAHRVGAGASEFEIVQGAEQICNLLMSGRDKFTFDHTIEIVDIVSTFELLNSMITHKMKNNILYAL